MQIVANKCNKFLNHFILLWFFVDYFITYYFYMYMLSLYNYILIFVFFKNKINIFSYCRLKAYCIDFLGRKINLSGISPVKRSRSGPNSVYMDRSRLKGWQRSGNFGRDRPILAKMGAGTSLAEPVEFFCLVNHATFWQLRNGHFYQVWSRKRISVYRRGIHKDIFENFHFKGHLPPKSEIEIRSNRHPT